MKKTLLIIALSLFSFIQIQAQNGVAISTSSSATPDASAILDLQSTTQGLLIPRMTESQKTSMTLTASSAGLMVYQTDVSPGIYVYYGFAYGMHLWFKLGYASEINDLSDGKTTNNSVCLGYNAGVAISNGSNNTTLGYKAGESITSGGNNIVVGSNISTSTATASDEINIGNTILATGTGTAAAKVGIGNGNNAPKSTLDIDGSINIKFSLPSVTNYSVLADDYLIISATGSGINTVTLPDPSTCGGRIYIVKNVMATSITVATTGSYNIDGTATVSLIQYKFIKVFSLGASGWIIIGQN